jgi:hypothetical protein
MNRQLTHLAIAVALMFGPRAPIANAQPNADENLLSPGKWTSPNNAPSGCRRCQTAKPIPQAPDVGNPSMPCWKPWPFSGNAPPLAPPPMQEKPKAEPKTVPAAPKVLPGSQTRSPDDFELFLERILDAPSNLPKGSAVSARGCLDGNCPSPKKAP